MNRWFPCWCSHETVQNRANGAWMPTKEYSFSFKRILNSASTIQYPDQGYFKNIRRISKQTRHFSDFWHSLREVWCTDCTLLIQEGTLFWLLRHHYDWMRLCRTRRSDHKKSNRIPYCVPETEPTSISSKAISSYSIDLEPQKPQQVPSPLYIPTFKIASLSGSVWWWSMG